MDHPIKLSKNLISSVLLLVLAFQGFAQSTSWENGHATSMHFKNSSFRSLMSQDSLYYIFLQSEKGTEAIYFNQSLEVENSYPRAFEARRTSSIWAYNYHGTWYGIEQHIKNINEKVLSLRLDQDSSIELFSVERTFGDFPNLHFQHTDNGFLVYHELSPNIIRQSKQIEIKEFEGLNPNYHEWYIDFEIANDMLEINRCIPMADKVLFHVKKYKHNSVDKRAGKVNYSYQLMWWDALVQNIKTAQTSPENAFTDEPRLFFEDGKLLSSCVVGNKQVNRQIDVFFTTIDVKKGEVKSRRVAMKDLSIAKSRFTYSKLHRTYKNFEVDDIVRIDSTYYVFIENKHIELYGMAASKPLLSFLNGPLCIVKIAADSGSIQHVNLNKYQFSLNDFGIFSSYSIESNDSTLNVRYNDGQKRFMGFLMATRINKKYESVHTRVSLSSMTYTSTKITPKPSEFGPPIWIHSLHEDDQIIVPFISPDAVRLSALKKI
jgi:hypothetical protein